MGDTLFTFEGPFTGPLKKRRKRSRKRGGIAQLGEHLPCKQGVMSSNLIISTTGYPSIRRITCKTLAKGVKKPVDVTADTGYNIKSTDDKSGIAP